MSTWGIVLLDQPAAIRQAHRLSAVLSGLYDDETEPVKWLLQVYVMLESEGNAVRTVT